MVVRDLTPGAAACRACGAYGNSQHRPTCRPDRPRFKLGRMRGVRRDSRTSYAARANAQVQRALIRGLSVKEDRSAQAR